MTAWTGIAVVDVDAGVPLANRQAYAAAQQAQIAEDFAPRWERALALPCRAVTPDKLVQPGEIEVQLINQPTMTGALGYHDVKPDGTPIAYVFTGLAKALSTEWTSVASHEVLEILGDPYLRRTVQMADGFWDMEICDRVEQLSYQRDGVWLSNFNFPECFEPPVDLTGVKFDHMGFSTRPNQVLPGGYAQRFDPSKGWVQVGTMSTYRAILASMGLGRGAHRRAITRRSSFWQRVFGLGK